MGRSMLDDSRPDEGAPGVGHCATSGASRDAAGARLVDAAVTDRGTRPALAAREMRERPLNTDRPDVKSDGVAYARAVLNILEDFAGEKQHLQAAQRAVINILEDFSHEKRRLEEMTRAVLNVLDDLAVEKARLELTQQEVMRSEQLVRASLREKETLLKEVHHRVKNNLQVISSLLSLQARYMSDELSRTLLEESQDRVHSIALVHEALYQSGDLASIEFCVYLRSLVAHLLDSWRGMAGRVRVSVDAVGVRLPVDVAIPCGLIVNELVTNSLKHAFPGDAEGEVVVRVEMTPPRRIRLRVSDTGIGLPRDVDLKRSGSLGLELVATLARQLHADVVVTRAPGTTFDFGFAMGGE